MNVETDKAIAPYKYFAWAIASVACVMLLISYTNLVAARNVEPEVIYRTEYVEVEVEVPAEENPPYYSEIKMTEEEYHMLAKILYLEAGGESDIGQRAVVEVVFNRVLDDRFPDTVKEVLSQKNGQKYQFSTYKNIHAAKPNQEQYSAIDAVLRDSCPILLPEVVYFATYDANGTYYETIGGHVFGV